MARVKTSTLPLRKDLDCGDRLRVTVGMEVDVWWLLVEVTVAVVPVVAVWIVLVRMAVPRCVESRRGRMAVLVPRQANAEQRDRGVCVVVVQRTAAARESHMGTRRTTCVEDKVARPSVSAVVLGRVVVVLLVVVAAAARTAVTFMVVGDWVRPVFRTVCDNTRKLVGLEWSRRVRDVRCGERTTRDSDRKRGFTGTPLPLPLL
jgi:hypothetical protein